MVSFAHSVAIGEFRFDLIQELNPKRDGEGNIQQFMPQARYGKRETSRLNRHGHGPFCKFTINSKWVGCSGVYALFNYEKLLYIGECLDLHSRYNTGYGNISPKNCFEGGQPTNCKINMMILNQYINGDKVALYFHQTYDYKRIESQLIRLLNPPYNGAGVQANL